MRRNPYWLGNLLWRLVVSPFVPWSLGRRPAWVTRNLGDWWKEDVCRTRCDEG
jgi:hypothetical protein